MVDSNLIDATKNYISEKIKQTKRKFDILFSSVKDLSKKDSLARDIKQIENDLKLLNSGNFEEKDLKRYQITEEDLRNYLAEIEKEKKGDYKILRNIIQLQVSVNCFNSEVNAIWSYLNFYGEEYLGLLSEQNLKLDYGHAYQRDQFFNSYNECIRTIMEYGDICDQLAAAVSSNKEYRERLISLQNKQYRDVIIKVGKFLRSLKEFMDDIFTAEANGEKVLLEPDKIVEITGENATISGVPAKQALLDMYNFVEEFIDFLKIPDMKKIKET